MFCFEIGERRVSGHMVQVWGLVKRMLLVVVVVLGVVGVIIVVVMREGRLRDGK